MSEKETKQKQKTNYEKSECFHNHKCLIVFMMLFLDKQMNSFMILVIDNVCHSIEQLNFRMFSSDAFLSDVTGDLNITELQQKHALKSRHMIVKYKNHE